MSLAFRRWRRPTVVAGGRLRTAVGVLAIDAVTRVTRANISERDARRAGYTRRAELLEDLDRRREGRLYRIILRYSGPDEREALARRDVSEDLRRRLDRLPWAIQILRLISGRPGIRAADLATSVGLDKVKFKRDVRKLKELGLTKSLEVGYELSPRGRAVIRAGASPPGRREPLDSREPRRPSVPRKAK